MNEQRKKLLIEKCKSEIRRYRHLIKTFDPNEGEEMEEYQQNIQDWNDIISVNTLALATLTAQPVKLPQIIQIGHTHEEITAMCNVRNDAVAAIRAAGYQVESE